MSVLRPRLPEDPLAVEALRPGDDPGDARCAEALADLVGGRVPPDPAAAAALGVEGLLDEYGLTRSTANRRASRLFSLLGAARDLAAEADRIVVVGAPGALAGLRLLLSCCAHPWHDQLGRGERGGRPRVLFLPAAPCPDPDALAGLVDLLGTPQPPGAAPPGRDLLDRGAVVVLPDLPPEAEGAVALLERCVAGRVARLADLGVGATGGAAALVGPAGVLVGALAGVDVVRLLAGAAALVARSRAGTDQTVARVAEWLSAPPAVARGVVACAASLDPLPGWYRHLLAEAGVAAALVDGPVGAAPLPTRWLAVSGGTPRRDPVGSRGTPQASPAVPSGLPGGATGALIRLPRIDEHSLGQLAALLLLATAVERWARGG